MPTTKEFFDEVAEEQHAIAVSYPKRKFALAAPVPSKLFHCAIFRVADKRDKRVDSLKRTFPLSSGGYVEFVGPELRQDDGKVFAILGHMTAGYGPAHGATFNPNEVVKMLGWSKSKHSLKRLDACLMRLRKADLMFFNSNDEKEWVTGLVLDITYKIESKPDCWHVALSDKLSHGAFLHFSQTTHLNIALMAKLQGELASWLYAFVASNACDKPLALDELLILSGSGSKCAKEWGRQVREALDILQEHEIIVGYTSKRGSVEVHKNPRQPRG